jgi:hypothetical protein
MTSRRSGVISTAIYAEMKAAAEADRHVRVGHCRPKGGASIKGGPPALAVEGVVFPRNCESRRPARLDGKVREVPR